MFIMPCFILLYFLLSMWRGKYRTFTVCPFINRISNHFSFCYFFLWFFFITTSHIFRFTSFICLRTNS
uniref:Uncharacterized protein n=1 Tax=Panstrongylus lignarius TaxID=156445 RepID=A0A224XUW5_9HEMI